MSIVVQVVTSPVAGGGADVSLFPFPTVDEAVKDSVKVMEGHGGKWVDRSVMDWICEDGWTVEVQVLNVGVDKR